MLERVRAVFKTVSTIADLEVCAFFHYNHNLNNIEERRDFVYGYNVTSAPFVREDQFKNIPTPFWDASPTSILHLAQHTFESILLENTSQSDRYVKSLFGYHADLQHYDQDKCTLDIKSLNPTAPEDMTLHCDYVIAADGAHSPIRDKLHIPMEGNPSMQNLMNIHFVSPGLHKLLGDRSGMLYFIFNKVGNLSCCWSYVTLVSTM